jgi:hypothetical protein
MHKNPRVERHSGRKLKLRRDTLRHLHAPELQPIHGGDDPPTDHPRHTHVPGHQMVGTIGLYHC